VLDIPAGEMQKPKNCKANLSKKAAESDESLMEAFFEHGTLTEAQLEAGLKTVSFHVACFPYFCMSAKHNKGVGRLMEFICSSAPGPDDMPFVITTAGKELKCSAADPASLQIFKVSIEEHLGEISFFKVFGGEISEAMDLVNSTNSSKERIPSLLLIAGKKTRES